MFQFSDLSRNFMAGPGFETQCPVFGCTLLPTCIAHTGACGGRISCVGVTCGMCTHESLKPCGPYTRRPFTDVTREIVESMTDAVDLATLHEELRRLSNAAAERRDEIRDFIQGEDDDEDNA